MVVKTPNFKGVLSKVSLNLWAKNYYTAMFSDDYIGLWVSTSILLFRITHVHDWYFLLSLAWQSTIRCFYRYNAKTGMLGRLNNKCLLSAQRLPFFDWLRFFTRTRKLMLQMSESEWPFFSGTRYVRFAFLFGICSYWFLLWPSSLSLAVVLAPFFYSWYKIK